MIAFKKLKLVKAIITQLGVYPYFKKYYKLVPIDLSKQQALDADSKAIEQIGFTIYNEMEIQKFLSLLKKQKKPFSDCSKGTVHCYLIHSFQGFVRLLQMVHQLI